MPSPRTANPSRAEYGAVVSLVVFVGLLGLGGAIVGLEDLRAPLGRVSLPLMAPLLALSLVNYGLRSVRWHLFQRRLGLEVPFARTVLVYVGGFAMAATPAKAGEVLRSWLLRRCHGYGYSRTLPLLVADRLSDAAAILLLCLVGSGSFDAARTPAIALAAALLVTIVALSKPALLGWLIARAFALCGRWRRLFAWLRRTIRRGARLFTWRVCLAALALGVVGWLAECLALHWLLLALGADIGLQRAVFVFAFAMLAGALTMAPGGLGGTEAAMFGLLTLSGVVPQTALVATVLIRITTLWFAVVLGFAALVPALRSARATVPPPAHVEAPCGGR